MTTASEAIADYALGSDPSDARAGRRAARAVLDTVGAAVAGRAVPSAGVARAWAQGTGAGTIGAGARDWTTGSPLPVEQAAFVNGVAAHALDLDDVSMLMWGHPSALLVPVGVAAAEAQDASIGDLLDAYLVGLHVDHALGAAFDLVEHYDRGWHASVTVGVAGAVVTAARLLALDHRQTVHALGIAVSMMSGTRQNFGTMTKAMHIGLAASNVVRACELARAGCDASDDALEGPLGFFALYGTGSYDRAALDGRLRAPELESVSSLNVKRYPCCYQTHRAIDAALDIRAAQPTLDPGSIDRVEVVVNPGSDNSLIHPFARTPDQARFCMRYVVARALVTGEVNFSSFEPDTVLDERVQELMRKVHLDHAVEPPFEETDYELDYAAVRVSMTSGDAIHRTCTAPRGNAHNPLDEDEALAKVDDCLAHGDFVPHARTLAATLTERGRSTTAFVDAVRALDKTSPREGKERP